MIQFSLELSAFSHQQKKEKAGIAFLLESNPASLELSLSPLRAGPALLTR
jgi:hypothetical protein